MALDAATLALTAAELKTTLADAKIAKLFEPTRDELVITLRTRTDTYALLLSARSGSARVCLTEETFENPETPPSFCMLMRKHLTGGKLLDVRMEPGDRIVYFDFQCTNEMGDLVRNTLCAELMGRYSNLVLEGLMRKNELTGQERAFCTALFYGVVERRITLDWVLGRYSRQPVEKLSPAVRDILRMAVYQLLYMPSIPERAAVNEAVKETRAMRVSSASGYVNGVLRAFLRDGKKIALPREPLAALSVQYAVPKALIALWRQGYGEGHSGGLPKPGAAFYPG